MALMPGAVIKLIPRHNVGKRRPTGRGTSFHVTASAARSMFGYFGTVGDCSHFHVAKDGTIEQYIDTVYYGRAQVDGNDMVSVETQGAAPGVNAETEPWTDAQVVSNARIARWVHDTEGAPLVLMPDSRPGSRGVGYHRLGIAPWRVKGGQVWSTHDGKVCPGTAKIRQLPRVIALAGGSALSSPITTLPVQEDDDMPTAQEIAKAVWEYGAVGRPSGPLAAARMLDLIDEAGGKILAAVDAVPTAVWDHEVPRPGTTPMRSGELLGWADRAASIAATAGANPAAVAAELLPGLVEHLSAGTQPDQLALEAALRGALRSLA